MMSLKRAHVPMIVVAFVGVSSIVMSFVGSALKTKLSTGHRRSWLVANRYQMSHTVALGAIAWLMTLAKESPEASSRLQKGFYLVTIGALGFAGSVYSLCMRWRPKVMGPLTPVSGLVLVIGWIYVGLAGLYW